MRIDRREQHRQRGRRGRSAIAALGVSLALVGGDSRAGTQSGPECGTNVNSATLDPQATSTTFGAGALIIPMDSCYNPDNAGNGGPMNVGGSCGAGTSY